ncbi:MAG: phosphoribosylamine--glycine ligase [Actinobacteria bacterium 13_1_40CM_2_65_8]|nr:MAG: phosphoribosylamine--glycine ligase [Actinobacteria bacterium 13_1_40CM_4_65_12]OLD49239.1 MAG: phosphoribosylamine--glycine ligase [Actinobacteria bacterium 13_1_40CM_2_65_8]
MKVLVVGSGAREHALVWKCVQSELVERVYCAPGNGGTGGMARNVAISVADVVRIVEFAKRERLGLVVLGPEAAVDAGVGDALRSAGFNVFGPNRRAGRIESSKSFAKRLMVTAGIPTADFEVFSDPAPARAWARERNGLVAVKADGLARGKGVIVCSTVEEANAAVDAMLVHSRFGRSGATIVLEEKLAGPELSVLGITDGTDVVALAPARDFKRVHDGDRGPNTGGMGAYSPPLGVDGAVLDEVLNTVLKPAVRELAASGDEFRGVLYAGLMLTPKGIRTLEFNARFGDPEAQVVLPRLESDFVALALAAAKGTLASIPEPTWNPRAAVGVVVASANYPDDALVKTGFPIRGLAEMPRGVQVFHGGTRFEPGRGLVTDGGRVVTSVALGDTVAEAREKALAGARQVRFQGAFYRSDIALEAI